MSNSGLKKAGTYHKRISAWELAIVLLLLRLVEPTTFFSLIDYQKGTGSWLAPIITFILGLGLLYLYCKLIKAMQGQHFLDFVEQRLGKVMRWVIGLLLLLYMFILTAISFREVGDVIESFFLVKTPVLVIVIIMLLLVIQANIYGLQTICRVSTLIFPVVIVGLLLVLGVTATQVNILNLVPLADGGWKSVTASGFYLLSRLNVFVILLLLAPYVRDQEKIFPTATAVMTFDMLMMMTAVIYVYGIFGRVQGNYLVFEFLEVARIVGTQLDIISISGWILFSFVRAAVVFYTLNLLLRQLLHIDSCRELLVPLGILVLNYSVAIYANTVERSAYVSGAAFPYQLLMILLPLLLWGVIRLLQAVRIKR